jgi:GcrA cell cycle regulator
MSKRTGKHKTIATLESNDCRWPIGDPRHSDFHFCGARALTGRPYCELHWRASIQPLRLRHEQMAPVVSIRRAA